MASLEVPTFTPALIRGLLKQRLEREGRSENDVKLISHSAEAVAEYGRMFVVEAIRRAGEVARSEGARTIDRSHVERVMAELLLDFQ
jgi:hypothetical protein